MAIQTIDVEQLLDDYKATEIRLVFGNRDKDAKCIVLRINDRLTHDFLLHYETLLAKSTGHSYIPKVAVLQPDDTLEKIEKNQKALIENA